MTLAVSGTPGALSMPTIVSGTSGLGIKRPINAGPDYQPPPAAKKARGRAPSVGDAGGKSWTGVNSVLVNCGIPIYEMCMPAVIRL